MSSSDTADQTAAGMRPVSVRSPEGSHASRFRAVLFDLDETLIDRRTTRMSRGAAFLAHSLAPWVATDTHAMGTQSEAPARSRPEYQGGGVFRRQALRLMTVCYQRLARTIVLDTETEQVLTTLQQAGLSLGIVSNGSPQKHHTIHLLGLDRRTSCIFVSGTFGRRKPDPAIFHAALTCLGMPAEEVLFVGDKPGDDISGARRAGMKTAWLRRKPRRQIFRRAVPADLTLDTLPDLLEAIGLLPRGDSRTMPSSPASPSVRANVTETAGDSR